MNVLLLTDNIDGTGVCVDVKFLKDNLVDKCNVTVIHFGDLHDPKVNVYSLNKLSFFDKYKEFKRIITDNNINIAHIRGLMSGNHMIWFTLLIVNNIPYLISPSSQLNYYNLNNKLFYEEPDINSLDDSHKSKISYRKKLVIKFIPFLKRLYLRTVGKFVISRCKGLICFSEFEKKFAVNYKKKIYVVKEPNLLDDIASDKTAIKCDTYSSETINIVYWGRLDYYLKGIDRLIDMCILMKNEFKDSNILIHLMGPDYNGGLKKIRKAVADNKLENIIKIYGKDVWKGSNLPLVCADYSVLLSRWDGYPRALRESVSFGVPVLVSEETNFWDIVTETGCGYRLDGNIDTTRDVIKNIVNTKNYPQKLKGCLLAQKLLSKKAALNNLVNVYRECYESSR